MTAIGLANCFFGMLGAGTLVFVSIGSIVALSILLQAPRPIQIDLGEWNERAAVALLATPIAGVLDVILLVSGIQILRMAPSGRTLSLVYAICALPLTGVDFWLLADNGTLYPFEVALCLLSPLYSCALIVLFSLPSWRKTFHG